MPASSIPFYPPAPSLSAAVKHLPQKPPQELAAGSEKAGLLPVFFLWIPFFSEKRWFAGLTGRKSLYEPALPSILKKVQKFNKLASTGFSKIQTSEV
jgi:hypothetical protein